MNKPVYLDNAATTPLEPKVLEAMLPYLQTHFGNPSSTYSYGRTTRSAIEHARRSVAELLGVRPNTIIFTSGGTESNNTAIMSAVRDLKCDHIITSPIEHHAVLNTVKHYCAANEITCSFVNLSSNGEVDLSSLEQQLTEAKIAGRKCLVSLMHANNEIGTILDIEKVGDLCKRFGAIYHADCVQTIGHYPVNLFKCGVHFASAAGHKFHGPKGTGILYVSDQIKAAPLIFGGGQERNMRAGTENVYGIVGFAKALELASAAFENEGAYIQSLKDHMRQQLIASVPGVSFHEAENALYTVLSVCFPDNGQGDMLVMQFDMAGVCVSGGSACSSGDDGGSHVIKALNKPGGCTTVRFSFSKYNTTDDIDIAVNVAKRIIHSSEIEAQ